MKMKLQNRGEAMIDRDLSVQAAETLLEQTQEAVKQAEENVAAAKTRQEFMDFQRNGAGGLQGWMDMKSEQCRKERGKSQLTLGGLIKLLEDMESSAKVSGIGEPLSYRGYYSDLAFRPNGEATETAASLLTRIRKDCMGHIFQGYKGGDFLMGEDSPLWIAGYGDCGPKLMGLKQTSDVWQPETEEDEW